LKTKEFVQKNNSTLLGTVIAIIVVAGGVMGVNSYRSSGKAGERRLWQSYGRLLRKQDDRSDR
jgi:hypothetical protein